MLAAGLISITFRKLAGDEIIILARECGPYWIFCLKQTRLRRVRHRCEVNFVHASYAACQNPPISPKFNQYVYGKWQFGLGVNSVKRLDIMAPDYSGASVANTARLLKFFTITDIHIADKESPVQAIFAVYNGGSDVHSNDVFRLKKSSYKEILSNYEIL